jgi:hypothetical protein
MLHSSPTRANPPGPARKLWTIWDEVVFEDSYLADFEMASDADLENGIEVEPVVDNLFAFGN